MEDTGGYPDDAKRGGGGGRRREEDAALTEYGGRRKRDEKRRKSSVTGNVKRAFARARVGMERMQRKVDAIQAHNRDAGSSGGDAEAGGLRTLGRLRASVSSLRGRLAAGAGRETQYEPTLDRITSVESFFRYTESAGKLFFDKLDVDGDGLVTVDDLKREMRRRNLPEKYAYSMLRRCSKRAFFPPRRVDWDAMRELMNEREVSMLRAYSSLGVNDKSGTISEKDIKKTLTRLGKDSDDSNVGAMVRYLIESTAVEKRRKDGGADSAGVAAAGGGGAGGEAGSASEFKLISSFFHNSSKLQQQQQQQPPLISYSDFRNFIILLPPETIRSEDPSTVWFNAATIIPAGPAIAPAAGTVSTALVVRSAIAGGLASGTSTLALHPLDTLKTRLQASVGGKPLLSIVKNAIRGGKTVLFRGSVPAVVGAACSHGTRTGIYEVFKAVLTTSLPFLPAVQVQGLSSAAGTLIGTGVRIPCEVLKQQLQNGNHDNVIKATAAIVKSGGPQSLFRGTAATLAREIPFYVLGMVMYEQLKDGIRAHLGRELRVYETISVGAMSGALAAAATTPFDVIKTRYVDQWQIVCARVCVCVFVRSW